MRIARHPLLITSVAAVASALAIAQSGDVDYSALPPQPTELRAQLDNAGLTLTDAVATAEAHVGGKACAATFDTANGGSIYSVEVLTSDELHTIVIDASTGEITGTRFVKSSTPGWDIPEGAELVTTSSGLKYFDIVVGDGAQPEGPTDTVRVHYTGYLVDGKKFDSSVDRGQPIDFPLNRVIPGWTEGVGSMHVGGKRKLLIPYQLGYGERGMPGAIPPRALLVFDVELLELP